MYGHHLLFRLVSQSDKILHDWLLIGCLDSGLSRILLHDLHWLDVPQRVIFKLCMTVSARLSTGVGPTSPSCAFRLRMLSGAVNYVLLADDF